MVQQIAIDPDLWARTRRKAFDTKSTASKIVAAALVEYLDRMDKPQARLAITEHHGNISIGKVTSVATTEAGVEVGYEPWPRPESLVPQAVVPVIEKELRGDMDALPPPAVIKDPAEVGAAIRAVAPGREFHPVPKPASTRKPRAKPRG